MSGVGGKAIFISYASEDAAAAGRISTALRAAGLEAWFDQNELRGGDAWDASIRRQVRECALFVALISVNTESRSEGYFRREWHLAVQRMLDMADDAAFLLPVVVDDITETDARVPDLFRERQWSRLPDGVITAEFVDRVKRLLMEGRRTLSDRSGSRAPGAGLQAEPGFWIAVLPFSHAGSDADLDAIAEGLSEEIVAGLSHFSYLRVIALSSSRRYADEAVDVRDIGAELGARYLMQGSLRRAGDRLRISVQLVDAASGAHLWVETYDRRRGDADIFTIQDEITDRVVATVADPFGVLARSMVAPLALKPPETLTPPEAVLRYFLYRQRVSASDHLAAGVALVRAVGLEPANADAWACLAMVQLEEFVHDFNLQPDPLDRALASAQRAVDADPASQLGWAALAQAQYHRQDLGAFRVAADRAVALNRRSSNTLAILGILFGYGGDWERGLELTTIAMKINPHHPGWYRMLSFFDAYRRARYADALDIACNIGMPQFWADPLALTIANAQLGHHEAAAEAAHNLLKVWPDFKVNCQRVGFDAWMFAQPELVSHIFEGLRKAGLDIRASDNAD